MSSSPLAASSSFDDSESIPKIHIPKAALKPLQMGKQVISIRIPAVKKPPPPPNTVLLSDLLEKAVQKCYGMLESMFDLLPRTSPSEKKRILLLNLSLIKEIMIKLYLLAQDVDHFPKLLAAMNACQEIEAFDSKLFGLANELYGIHAEAHKIPLPAFDVDFAFEAMIGCPNLLPCAIWERRDFSKEQEEFEQFLTRKLRIKCIPLKFIRECSKEFEFDIEKGMLNLSFKGGFKGKFSFNFITNHWVLLQVRFLFLELHGNLEFADYFNSILAKLMISNEKNLYFLDELSQIIKLIFSFACHLRINQLVSGLGQSICMLPLRLVFWEDEKLREFFVEFSISTSPDDSSVFSGGDANALPCIRAFCNALEEDCELFVSIDQNLSTIYSLCKSKTISHRLNSIQYFLPEFFQVGNPLCGTGISSSSSILITALHSEHLVYIDDATGKFKTLQRGQQKVTEFADSNGLTEYLFDCFLEQVQIQILKILSSVKLSQKAFVSSNLQIQIEGKGICIQITKQGIQISNSANGEILHLFDSYEFDLEKYLEVYWEFRVQQTNQAFQKAFSKYSSQISSFVCFEIAKPDRLECGILQFQDRISTFSIQRPGFKCCEAKFVFDLEFFPDFESIFALLLRFFEFATFLATFHPSLQWKGSPFLVEFCNFRNSCVQIHLDSQSITIDDDDDQLKCCFYCLFNLYICRKDWKMLIQTLEFRFNLLNSVSNRVLSNLLPAIGGECINLFFEGANSDSHSSIQFNLRPISTSTFVIMPEKTHQFMESICKQALKLTEFESLYDLLVKWAEATGKFSRLKKILGQTLGQDKIKISKSGSNIEFTFNSFVCSFSIGIPTFKISFIQNILLDKLGSAFIGLVEEEIAQNSNIGAVLYSLLNLLRTSHAFIRDFSRVVSTTKFGTPSGIALRCPFVLSEEVAALAKRIAGQNAIAFNPNTKSVTLLMQLQQRLSSEDDSIYSMLLIYNLDRNTCDVLPLGISGDVQQKIALLIRKSFDDYTAECDQGTIQLFNYVGEMVSKIMSNSSSK